eukprot:scaffold670705_cov86-Prasinocladus_malaysianus.AAC.1
MERYGRVAGMYSGSGGGGAADTALRAACRDAVSLAHARNQYQEESIAQYRCPPLIEAGYIGDFYHIKLRFVLYTGY